jgi:hypothetical protein
MPIFNVKSQDLGFQKFAFVNGLCSTPKSCIDYALDANPFAVIWLFADGLSVGTMKNVPRDFTQFTWVKRLLPP